MTQTEKILLIAGLAAGATLLFMSTSYLTYLVPFFEKWESFSPSPYWDVSRWSWGYGTQVPGSGYDRTNQPTGTITRAQAFKDSLQHILEDKAYLQPLLSVHLTPRQWAAWLDFSYNLGPGDADNLVDNINSQDMDALGIQWNKYIYAGGVISPDLVARRAAEWQLFNG